MTDFKNRIVGHGSKPASQFQSHPNNWRKHPKNQRAAVKGSLESLGWIDTVIENVTTGRLVDGHERVWNALQNGDADVPYIQVELTEAEEAQALLSLDAIAALAETDREQVDALLKQVETDNADVMQFLTDFAKDNKLDWNQPEQGDAEPQIDRAAELLEKWKVETGDLWQIGLHKLLCGDSTKREDVERVTGGEKVGAIVTDPPYGLRDSKSFNDDHADYEDEQPFDLSLLDLSIPFVIWGGNYYETLPIPRNKIGWVVWDKRPNLEGEKRVRADRRLGQHFEIAVTTIGGLRGKMLRHTWGGYYGDEEIVHKTQKPTPLFQDCIELSEGDVLDYFAGSGTTMVACQNLNRKCRAIEISPAYCAVILERMSVAFPDLKIERL